jgi:CDP-diacylglycerol--glycerol-3-phosphate 3-phosphatidyltransferase
LLLLWPGPGAEVVQAVGWWLFWPSLLLALSSAIGYMRAP